jgi:hypothetical protein
VHIPHSEGEVFVSIGAICHYSQYGDMVYKSEDTSIRRQRLGHGERPSDEASEVPGEVEQSAPEFGGGS